MTVLIAKKTPTPPFNGPSAGLSEDHPTPTPIPTPEGLPAPSMASEDSTPQPAPDAKVPKKRGRKADPNKQPYVRPQKPFEPMTRHGRVRPDARHIRYQCCEACGVNGYITEMAIAKALERGLISQHMQLVALPNKAEGTVHGMLTPLVMLLRHKGIEVR